MRFAEYQHIPGNCRVPYVAEYSAYAFDRALSGPFNNLFPVRLSAARALCAVMRCFYLHLIGFAYLIGLILTEDGPFVKRREKSGKKEDQKHGVYENGKTT